jgi:hypothetical protein
MSKWQDISTAPKDRRILLGKVVGHPAHGSALWWAVAGSWSERFQNWNDGVEPAGLAQPNVWCDLPSKDLLIAEARAIAREETPDE